MDNEPTEELRGTLQILRQHYRQQLAVRMQTLAPLVASFLQDATVPTAELMRHAHQLAGTAGSYGFPELTDAARALEYALLDGDLMQAQSLAMRFLDICHRYAGEVSASSGQHVSEAASSGTIPILVVDDDPLIALLLRKLLGSEMSLTCVESGEAAADYLKHHRPALVFLDLHLANGESGMDVLRALRANQTMAELPVIMMTASASPALISKTQALGVRGILVKPLEAEQVRLLVASIL